MSLEASREETRRCRAELEAAERSLEAEKEETRRCKAELEAAERSLKAAREEAKGCNEELKGRTAGIEGMQADLAALRERGDSAEARSNDLEIRISVCEEERDAIRLALVEAEEEGDALRQTLQEKEAALERASKVEETLRHDLEAVLLASHGTTYHPLILQHRAKLDLVRPACVMYRQVTPKTPDCALSNYS